MTCPTCGAHAAPQVEFCPSCLGELPPKATAARPPAAPERTPGGQAAVAPASPAKAAPRAQAVVTPPEPGPPPLAKDAARCAEHPDMPAAGTCERCGAFYCERCVPETARLKKAMCPRCANSAAFRAAPERLRSLCRELGVSFIVLGIGLGVLAALPGLGATGEVPSLRTLGHAGVSGLLFASPLAVCGIALLVSRSVVPAWIGFLLELAIVIVAVITFGVNLCWALFLAAPVMTLMRIASIHEQREILQRGASAAPTPAAAPR